MKTRKYTYTCEHPGSDVIITSDKPMDSPICPLCASRMMSFYDKILGVQASGRKDCPWCGATPLTVFFRGVEGKHLSGRQCPACDYVEYDHVPGDLKNLCDLPVRDIDTESAEAGKELWYLISGGVRDIRVHGKVVMTGNPSMPAHKEITEQTFSMENRMTKYYGKLISEVDFYFESDEEIKHSYDPADYPEQVKALIEQESMKLGKDRFRVAAMWKHQTGTFKNSSEEQQER